MIKRKKTSIGIYIALAVVVTLVILFLRTDFYVSICLVLIAALLVFVFSNDFKKFREGNELGSNTIITLVATMVGVYLAVSIANNESVRAEQQRKAEELETQQQIKKDEARALSDKQISILKAIQNDFYLANQSLEDYDRGFLSTHYYPKEGKPLKEKNSKIISEPNLLGEYLKQDLILTAISQKIINDFLSVYRNASDAYKSINEDELKTPEDFRLRKDMAIMYTQMFMWLIDLQIAIMKGEKNDEQISERQIEIRFWSSNFITDLQKKYPNKFARIKLTPPDSMPKR